MAHEIQTFGFPTAQQGNASLPGRDEPDNGIAMAQSCAV